MSLLASTGGGRKRKKKKKKKKRKKERRKREKKEEASRLVAVAGEVSCHHRPKHLSQNVHLILLVMSIPILEIESK